MDLSTQDCVKLYVSSHDSRNPCPKHTSESSASAGHRSSWATVTGGSRHQSQRRIDTCLLCYALHQGKHKQVRLVLSLSVFYLHSAASKKEVVKGSQLHMLLVSSQGGLAGANMCPQSLPKHTQDITGFFYKHRA